MLSIALTARPSYAKLHPILVECCAQNLPVEVVACGSSLITAHGAVADQVSRDFPSVPVTTLYTMLAGSTLTTSAKETGLLLASLADHYARVRPALVLVMADRHETLAVSMAASYQNIPVVHVQGGERSGNIDDRVRDANAMLATYHFPATEFAAERLRSFVHEPHHVWNVGCPSIDVARQAQALPPLLSTAAFGGIGPVISLRAPYLLLVQHPETEQPDAAYDHMMHLLRVVSQVPLPRLVLWPGQDAGQEGGAKAIRHYLTAHPSESWAVLRAIPPLPFLQVLNQAAVLVGNSSAGIREASYLGTPVVNIGSRQRGRERAHNVLECEDALAAIRRQLAGGRWPSSTLYGTGRAAPQLVGRLKGLPS